MTIKVPFNNGFMRMLMRMNAINVAQIIEDFGLTWTKTKETISFPVTQRNIVDILIGKCKKKKKLKPNQFTENVELLLFSVISLFIKTLTYLKNNSL